MKLIILFLAHLEFIESFYDKKDIEDIKDTIKIN